MALILAFYPFVGGMKQQSGGEWTQIGFRTSVGVAKPPIGVERFYLEGFGEQICLVWFWVGGVLFSTLGVEKDGHACTGVSSEPFQP